MAVDCVEGDTEAGSVAVEIARKPASIFVVFRSLVFCLRQDLGDDSFESFLDGGQCVFFRQLDLSCRDDEGVFDAHLGAFATAGDGVATAEHGDVQWDQQGDGTIEKE